MVNFIYFFSFQLFGLFKNSPIFAIQLRRSLSSAGSEHLPYKQGVTGSNPVGTTIQTKEVCSKKILNEP